jgi:hypothetical protein
MFTEYINPKEAYKPKIKTTNPAQFSIGFKAKF